MRVHGPLRCPFVGSRWVYALVGQYGKHMGRQACRVGNKLAMGPLRGPGVAANILHAYIWGIDGNNLLRDREGYDGFEYTDEKLSTRRIQWCG